MATFEHGDTNNPYKHYSCEMCGKAGALCYACHNERYPPSAQLKKSQEEADNFRVRLNQKIDEVNKLHAQLNVSEESHGDGCGCGGCVGTLWSEKYHQRSKEATQTEIRLQNKITELEAAYKQAANDAAYWCNKFASEPQQIINERNYLINKVHGLELAVKVLAELLTSARAEKQ